MMNSKVEKLSYKELIKALICCANTIETNMCGECPAAKYEAGKCDDLVKFQAASMLEGFKAENKKLNRKVNRLKKYDEKRDIDLHSRLTAIARVEAIKEFAERLKINIVFSEMDMRDLDFLVKEMVGEQ